MTIEILYSADCPHYAQTRALVERVRDELAIEADLRLIEVSDAESADSLRFLGSPTVRVDGRDIEPQAERRRDYALACRIYRTDHGTARHPDERWLRRALTAAATSA